jgi:hypothetical protein
MDSVTFITCGPYSWASSRLRAFWPARYMENTTILEFEDARHDGIPESDIFIWQKTANLEIIREMKSRGRKVWLDVCDPSWWWQPDATRKIITLVDGVVASNSALGAEFRAWSGMDCYTIPDRLDIAVYTEMREHRDAQPVRFIWFGASQNRFSLFGAIPILDRLTANGYKVELTVMDDLPDDSATVTKAFPIYYIKWQAETHASTMAAHDIAILPPYPGIWGKVKSNNKMLTAWACGLPVTLGENYDEAEMLVQSAQMRQQLGRSGRQEVERNYNVKASAEEWNKLLGRS